MKLTVKQIPYVCIAAAVLVAGIIVAAASAISGFTALQIPMDHYAIYEPDGHGGYTAKVDAQRIVKDFHLPDPELAEANGRRSVAERIDDFPEIKLLYQLGIDVQTMPDGSYVFNTELFADLTAKQVNEILMAGGLRLTNTSWTLTRDELAACLKTFSIPQYIVVYRAANGDLIASLDTEKLLRDVGAYFGGNAPESLVAVIRTLGVGVSHAGDKFDFSTTSTDTHVTEKLQKGGIQMIDTAWTWTADELAKRVQAGQPSTPIDTPMTDDTPAPGDTPAPDDTAMPSNTPAPTATVAPAPSKTGSLDSLRGYNQTALRKNIRTAKERYFGNDFKASEIKYNYFAVADNPDAQYANCFRIVYKITKKSGGTVWAVADAYNVKENTPPSAESIKITVYSKESDAKATDDFPTDDYTVHTLTGGSMVFDGAPKTPFDDDGLVLAKALTATITEDELWDLPQTKDYTLLQVLGFARNELFAQAGHKFSETGMYGKHFSKYSWYKPKGEVTATELGKQYPKTVKNITTIKSLEDLIRNG